MPEIRFEVAGFPPAKNEALSILGPKHPHASRVLTLLEAARSAAPKGFVPWTVPLGLEVELHAPEDQRPWDATNYLGGIGDTLEVKTRRGALPHLEELRGVGLYANDRQIREVQYRQVDAATPSYSVRLWTLVNPGSDSKVTVESGEREFDRQITAVFRSHRKELRDHRKDYPWLTGSLGERTAGMFFVAEIPSADAVANAHDRRAGSSNPNLQWSETRGDRLFRQVLGEQQFLVGDPMAPSGWCCYITDIIKSPAYAGEFAARTSDAQLAAARLWAPVLRWELKTGRPKLVVLMGGRTERLYRALEEEKLIPADLETTRVTHYAYIGQRADSARRLGPMHPTRVKEYRAEFAAIATRYERLGGRRCG